MNRQLDFIEEIRPSIEKYAALKGYDIISPIIAQACLESNYGKSSLACKYHNYFGMKAGSWKSNVVELTTKEEYKKGQLVKIKAKFRTYANMDAGVKGYFDFIASKRYAKLKTAKTADEYLSAIKAAGYATSSTYVKNCIAIIQKYDLTRYDIKPDCPFMNYQLVLKPGDNGQSVQWLQWHLNRLIKKGIINTQPLLIDGKFGLKTQEAFRLFQLAYPNSGANGKPDGKCGPRSRLILTQLVID